MRLNTNISLVMRAAILFSTLAVASLVGRAQDYQITTSTFGGGGSSSGGGFTVSGNVETTSANNLAGGDFSLASGFLAGVIVQQTPGAPMIIVMRNGSDLILTWTTSETGWTLQSNSALAAVGSWTTATESIVQENQTHTVTLSAPAGIRFYRLRKSVAE